MKQLNVRICNRQNTAANWSTLNPLLLKGEFGVEADTQKFKVGDGIRRWVDLPYVETGGRTYTAGPGISISNNVISAQLLYEVVSEVDENG